MEGRQNQGAENRLRRRLAIQRFRPNSEGINPLVRVSVKAQRPSEFPRAAVSGDKAEGFAGWLKWLLGRRW